jgi:hypothetical protein
MDNTTEYKKEKLSVSIENTDFGLYHNVENFSEEYIKELEDNFKVKNLKIKSAILQLPDCGDSRHDIEMTFELSDELLNDGRITDYFDADEYKEEIQDEIVSNIVSEAEDTYPNNLAMYVDDYLDHESEGEYYVVIENDLEMTRFVKSNYSDYFNTSLYMKDSDVDAIDEEDETSSKEIFRELEERLMSKHAQSK